MKRTAGHIGKSRPISTLLGNAHQIAAPRSQATSTTSKFWSYLRVGWSIVSLLAVLADLAQAQSPTRVTPELAQQTGDAGGPIAFRPDERLLATGSLDDSLKLWDLSTGLQLRTLSAHDHHVKDVAFSPDGRLVATAGGRDQNVKLWDAESGQEIRTLSFSRTGARADLEAIKVAFSPDGQWLAAVGNDNSVTAWEVSSGRNAGVFRPSNGLDSVVAVNMHAHLAATADPDTKSVIIWDLESGKSVRTLSGHTDILRTLLFSGDGRYLVSGGHDIAKVWDVVGGREIYTLPGNENAFNFAFSPDASLLARASDNIIKIVDVATGGERVTISGGAGTYFHDIAFSPSGRRLASVIYDSATGMDSVKLWDVATGREVRSLRGYTRGVEALAVDRTSRWLAVGNRNLTLNLWDMATGQEVNTFGFGTRGKSINFGPNAAAFSSDGRLLASADTQVNAKQMFDHVVTVLEPATGRKLKSLSPFFNEITSISFSPDGKLLAASDVWGVLKVWQTNTWEEDTSFSFDQPSVRELSGLSPAGNLILPHVSITFSPDGHWLATNRPNAILIWDVPSRQIARRLSGTNIRSIAFSPDSKRLAAADAVAQTLNVWEVESGNHLAETPTGEVVVNSMAFSPDGRWLATAGEDGVVRLVDAVSGREVRPFVGHSGAVNAVVFSADGHWLISGSQDGSTRIWDLARGEQGAALVTFQNAHDWLVVAPNGLFDGTADGMQQAGWRMRNSNQLESMDSFFNDFYHPGLLVESLTDHPPRAQMDIAMAAQIPGLRTMLARKEAHVETRASKVVVCFEQVPGVAVQAPAGVGTDVPTEINGFRVVPTDHTCKYQKELQGDGNASDSLRTLQNLEPEVFTTPWDGKSSVTTKSTLHVLTVAVANYPAGSGFDPLPYTVSSAKAIEDFFQKQEGKINKPYAHIRVWPSLHDAAATRESIRNRLTEMANAMNGDDVALLYLAGHGAVVPGQEMFYFVPADGEETEIRSTGLSTAMLAEALRNMPARRIVLIIDACQSGGAVEALNKIGEVKARVEQEGAQLKSNRAKGQQGVGVHIIAATLPLSYAAGLKADESALAATLLDALNDAGGASVKAAVEYLKKELPETSEKAIHFRQVPLTSSVGLDFALAGK